MLVWDAFNRLVAVARKSDGAAVAAYSYLPDGRRSRKVVFSQTNPGVVEREVRFAWDGAQEVEEQSAAGVTLATFVWSPVYVDELVEFRREAAHPLGAGSFYAHQDVRCDVVAVTNASGVVVEKRRYDDFGREEIRDAGGAVVASSPSGLEYGFQGRRRDAETGWLYFRARFYDPEVGRFLSRDPVWDASNVGGWYTFVGNGPLSRRDPFGLQAQTKNSAKREVGDVKDLVPDLVKELKDAGLPTAWLEEFVKKNPTAEIHEGTNPQSAQWVDSDWRYDDEIWLPAQVFTPENRLKPLAQISPDDAAKIVEELFHGWLALYGAPQMKGCPVRPEDQEAMSNYVNTLVQKYLALKGQPSATIQANWFGYDELRPDKTKHHIPGVVEQAQGAEGVDEDTGARATMTPQHVAELKRLGLDLETPPPSKEGPPPSAPTKPILWDRTDPKAPPPWKR